MKFRLEEAMEILDRTPGALNALLRDLPDEWTLKNEGPETWSAYDVLGHLIHGEETDWIPRAKIIIEHGEATPFEPFDRFAQFEKSRGKSLSQLLDTFEALRAENIETLKNMEITPSKLERRGTHPALGTVTLEQLFSAWVVHDLDHISQIARVLSKQYTDETGPWKAYLSILNK